MENSNVNSGVVNSHLNNSRQQPATHSRHAIQGESRIQYIPYEKTIIEYEQVTKIEYIPRQKKIVEYVPVEYQTEYVPQVYHEKVIQYVPVERMQERVEYIPVERQIYHPPQEQAYEISQHHSFGHQNSTRTPPVYHPINTSSRIQQPVQYGTTTNQNQNISFQNGTSTYMNYPPPHNNSYYTKEPLPSSKRQHHL